MKQNRKLSTKNCIYYCSCKRSLILFEVAENHTMASTLKSIWSRYSVTIVMIPSLIGIHYGWNKMQYNRSLVTEQEQIDLPVVTFAKYCWRKIQGDEEKQNDTAKMPAVMQK